MEKSKVPTRTDIVEMAARVVYGGRILNNAHRGDVVEMMVLLALGEGWRHVGLGWHPWDLQFGLGGNRIRIQVKQTAALQLWGTTVRRNLHFGWKPNAPSYFRRDNPGEDIEEEGWFCDLFIIGIHDEVDPTKADQADPAQWNFVVIPACDLEHGLKSMNLRKATERWLPVPWNQLKDEVDKKATALRLQKQGEIRNLKGKFHWEGDLDQMRLD